MYFRMLCDCILSNEKLEYQNADFWIQSFYLIRRVVGGVDYKGVREIMKVLNLILFSQHRLSLNNICFYRKIMHKIL